MAKASGFSIRQRGFDPRWGHRAASSTCTLFSKAGASTVEPTNHIGGAAHPLAALPSSPRPGGSRHRATNAAVEVQLLAGRPLLLVFTPLSWWHQARASEARRSGFDSRQGLRRERQAQARLIPSFPQVQFLPLQPRRSEAGGGSHKAVREGSTPSVATFWVWLNLVEHRLREPGTGGSNPPTQTR